jgi:hypothetical protein
MADFFSTLFSGGAEAEAANRNRQALAQYGQTGTTALDTGLNQSTGALNTANTQANNLYGQNYGLYSGLQNTGTGYLDQGLQNSLGALQQGGQAYAPLSALAGKYGAGTDLYMNSLGVNGAAGNQAAVNAFQAGPGYEFTRDQGLDALNRRRAGAGMLGSGNADLDAIKYGTGLANQTYGDWQTRLAGLINPELSATQGAATGIAGNFRDQAALYGADTAARLGLGQTTTAGMAGANTAQAANDVALGNSLAGLYTGDATNRVGLQGNITSGNIGASNMQAQGESQGARNLLGLGTSLLGAAAGPVGSMFSGAGSAPSGLGSLFSQTLGNGTGYQTNPWSSTGLFGGGSR